MEEYTQIRYILDAKYKGAIERTGEIPHRFVMNRKTLEALCKEIFGDNGKYKGFNTEDEWTYMGVSLEVAEELKDNEVFATFK
jgi:hypothetical protein